MEIIKITDELLGTDKVNKYVPVLEDLQSCIDKLKSFGFDIECKIEIGTAMD